MRRKAGVVRERLLMDSGWRFHRGDFPTGSWLNNNERLVKWRVRPDDSGAIKTALNLDTSSRNWQTLDESVPQNAKYTWLRAELEKIPGPSRTLSFDCLRSNAVIYVNGKERYCYSAYLGDPVDVSLDEDWREDDKNIVSVLIEGVVSPKRIGAANVRGGRAAQKNSGPASAAFDDRAWQPVDLPHDFMIESEYDPNEDPMHGYRKPVVGWYRRTFNIPARDKGKHIWLEFDGIYRNSRIWVNGHYLGNHRSGYTSFYYDATDYINFGGKNIMAVRVDPTIFEGWWYEGGGIYRHVWLTKLSPIHIARWGVFITSEVNKIGGQTGRAIVKVQTKLENKTLQKAPVTLRAEVVDRGGKIITSGSSKLGLDAGQTLGTMQSIPLSKATLWSLKNPYLYDMVLTIEQDGCMLDQLTTTFGIRKVRFDYEKGFFLNDKPVKIKGTCNHQDFAGVGIALPDRIHIYKIEKLKEMGANAYRCSHHPPAPEVLDACDRLGMLVMDEHRALGDSPEILSQVESMVLRDRNHPSIFIWSLCNEEMVNQGTELGAKMARAMKNIITRLDPTRLTTAAMCAGFGKGLSSVLDIQGFNYYPEEYDKFHQQFPHIPCIGTEITGTTSARGICVDDGVRAYFKSYSAAPESAWRPVIEREWMAGGFIWTGFSYKGEPFPVSWPCVNTHFGAMDICGFPKDDYYYYKAWWGEEPVVHLAPHWNWTYMYASGLPQYEINIWCYSNCDQVELFLNGESQGIKDMTKYSHLEWTVKWQPGAISAKGYKNGKVVASTIIETTGRPAAIRLTPDRNVIQADGRDVSLITAKIVDDKGRVVPTADNEVSFEVSPNARLLGIGNGDPCSHEPDKASKRKAFNGLCMVIVQATEKAGLIRVRASSERLKGAGITVEAR